MLNFVAALIFFTRLPLGKRINVPPAYFKNVVSYWALTGWITAAIASGTLWLVSQVLPLPIAVLSAIAVRLLFTGALHEDGLADFLDGFGGGTSRERILAIMKDSHIGSYGVIGLVVYFMFLYLLLVSLPLNLACIAILAGDPCAKFCASLITLRLPYARKEEESKIKTIYNRHTIVTFLISLLAGILPMIIFMSPPYWLAIVLSIAVFSGLSGFMKKKIQGYTGDCCGAVFLFCEIAFYLAINVIEFQLCTDVN